MISNQSISKPPQRRSDRYTRSYVQEWSDQCVSSRFESWFWRLRPAFKRLTTEPLRPPGPRSAHTARSQLIQSWGNPPSGLACLVAPLDLSLAQLLGCVITDRGPPFWFTGSARLLLPFVSYSSNVRVSSHPPPPHTHSPFLHATFISHWPLIRVH